MIKSEYGIKDIYVKEILSSVFLRILRNIKQEGHFNTPSYIVNDHRCLDTS